MTLYLFLLLIIFLMFLSLRFFQDGSPHNLFVFALIGLFLSGIVPLSYTLLGCKAYKDHPYYQETAELKIRRHAYQELIALEKQAHLTPNNKDLWERLGDSLTKEERFLEALEAYLNFLKYAPEADRVKIKAVECFIFDGQRGLPPKAVALLRSIPSTSLFASRAKFLLENFPFL